MSDAKSASAVASPIENALKGLASAVRELHRREATGDLAALRRLDPEHPEAMAFLRLSVLRPVALVVDEMANDLGVPEALRRFAAVAQIMALRPDGLRPWGLGRDLADIGVTDARLGALLTARGTALRDQLRLLGRRLARDAGGLAFEDLGKLVLLDGWRDEQAEETRMQVARDVVRAQRHSATAATVD